MPNAEDPPPRKARLADRDAVIRCLPAGVRLENTVRWDQPRGDTVEDALIKVGAHVGPDGKLYSAAGKEIYFDKPGTGYNKLLDMPEEQKEATARQRRELEARYTIITLVGLRP
jgi:hypothetical protein